MKMKVIVLIITFFLFNHSFAQENTKAKIVSTGLGIGNENNRGNFGVYYTTDLKIETIKRLYINPRINFFQSLGSFENGPSFGYKSHSGLFLECGLSYSIIKKNNVELSLNAGPSFQTGSETYRSSALYRDGACVFETYQHNQLRRFGAYFDLELSWSTKNLINTIGIKSSMYYFYPEFLGIVYKIGLKI